MQKFKMFQILKKTFDYRVLSLGVLLGFYLSFIFSVFKEKIINIDDLGLGELGSFLGGVFSPILFVYITLQHLNQQSQLLEARKKEEEREKERIRSAQPIIEFSGCEYGYGDHSNVKINLIEPSLAFVSKRCIAIDLNNHGSLATNVRIISDHFSIFLPILKNGRNSVQEEFDSEIKEGDLIEILYIDILGMSRKKTYKIYALDKQIRDIPFVFSPPEAPPLPNRLYQDVDIRPDEVLE